jgi:hypothetical protein
MSVTLPLGYGAEIKEDQKGKKEYEDYLTKLNLQKADLQKRIDSNKEWLVGVKQLEEVARLMPVAACSKALCLLRPSLLPACHHRCCSPVLLPPYWARSSPSLTS